MTTKATKAPASLGREAAKLWRDLAEEYGITDAAGRALLGQACEALERIRSAQAAIAVEGVTTTDRWGQTKPHPCLTAERDARAGFLAALRALNLDLEPLRDRPTRTNRR